MPIVSITLYRCLLPLIRPYKLAFGDVDAFDTVLYVAGDDIDRAADLGAAAFVKLNLMKAGGISALADDLSALSIEAAVHTGGA
ncbi:MAG: hypothetical protein O3A85_03290 [Proteobacteria bacterium]|nr:hypothetical protein [Pseudomonadota bacterium]